MGTKIEYPNIEKMGESFSDSTYSYTLPPVTKEDKAWAKQMKKRSTGELKEELKVQIDGMNARRVHWLLDIDQVRRMSHRSSVRKAFLGQANSYIRDALIGYLPPLSQPRFDLLKGVILKYGPKPEYSYSADAASILSAAALHNHVDILGLYFDSGMHHAKDYVLNHAIKGKNTEAFDYLIEHMPSENIVSSISQAFECKFEYALERILQLDDAYYEDEDLVKAWLFEPLFKMCGPGTLKQFDHFLDITLKSGKYTIERILEYAILANCNDAARYLVSHHNVSLEDVAENLIDKALQRKNAKAIEYLSRQGIKIDKALKYYRDHKAKDTRFAQELAPLFKEVAKKKALVTWDVEDENTIRRTRTTDKVKTEWIFYFEEQTILQVTYAVSEENEKISDQLWQMADFKNQSLIAEAATVLSDKGGEPGDIYGKTAQPITGVDKPKFPNVQAVKS